VWLLDLYRYFFYITRRFPLILGIAMPSYPVVLWRIQAITVASATIGGAFAGGATSRAARAW
jgi:hypothetical protein